MSEYTIDFAVACEGVTDYAVLKNILTGFYKAQRAPRFAQRQPLTDVTGGATWQEFGNWENVFRFLREGLHRQVLEFSEYLIVQIDSDASEHPNFGVPQQEGSRSLSPEETVERISARLRQIIGNEDCAAFGNRLIFAVCVREMECWLLPLWESGNKAAKTSGCLATLNAALARKNQSTINPDDKKFGPYDNASREYRKRATLLRDGPKNPSLAVFLGELERREISREAVDD